MITSPYPTWQFKTLILIVPVTRERKGTLLHGSSMKNFRVCLGGQVPALGAVAGGVRQCPEASVFPCLPL